MKKILDVGALFVLVSAQCFCFAQNDSVPGVPVSVIATVEAKNGKTISPVMQAGLRVREAGGERQVTGWNRLGMDAGLQILLLIDDSSRTSFDTNIGELKQWINTLPAQAQVGVGYMHNGICEIVSDFSNDHAKAANSIRLTLGAAGADVSPYDSLSDAVKKWPKSVAARKEVVMISSGLEGLGGGWPPDNPYVNRGIEDAQRAGVVVFTIYNPSAGHAGHIFWRENMGQDFLSQLSEETGGESYITTFGPPVSFSPFLEDISSKLQNQYELSFDARAENKAGLQPLKVAVSEKNADVTAPSKVFVRASK